MSRSFVSLSFSTSITRESSFGSKSDILGSVDVHLSHNTVLANEMNAVKLVSVLQ